jgi:hypothetical protein
MAIVLGTSFVHAIIFFDADVIAHVYINDYL